MTNLSKGVGAFHATQQCRNSSIAPSIAANRRGSPTSFSRIMKNSRGRIGSGVAFLHEYTRVQHACRKWWQGRSPARDFSAAGLHLFRRVKKGGVLRAPRASHLTHPGRGNRTKNRRNPLGAACVHAYTRALRADTL